MFAAQADHEKSIGFIDPPRYKGQVRKPLGADGDRWFIESMPFIVLAHAYTQSGSQEVDVIRVKTYKN